jgi:uncharacterized repeat protein (TIGR01451 family)
VAKVDPPDPVQVGTRLAYTITVTNKGPGPATNVQLTDPLPGTVILLAVTPSQGTCTSGPILNCALGVIQPGQVVTVTVLVRPTATGRLENTATAVGTQPEANPADNSATAVTVVYGVTKPPKHPKPPKGPKPPTVCVSFRVFPIALRAGRPTTMRVVVRVGRQPGKGMRVVARGAGIHATATTRSSGVAVLRVRPTRTGFVTVTMPGRLTCGGPRRVGVVTPILRPPVTG